MICPTCRAENPEGAVFCVRCSAALGSTLLDAGDDDALGAPAPVWRIVLLVVVIGVLLLVAAVWVSALSDLGGIR